ncbi:MAG: S9 family peptidase, partial [Phycisphaeraceae bacterium]|nr:S9 family peptidase [Phycisphaeraceae bacterium]
EVPLHGVSKGPRQIAWRALAPATLTWAEALDEGDPETEVAFRDRLMRWPAPFNRPAQEIVKVKKRFSSLSWLEKKGLALLADYDWKERWQTISLINVDDKHFRPKVLFDLSTQDRYADPGRAVYKKTASGEYVVKYEDDSIFLSGNGASPEGDRPFLDKLNLASMEKDRLFHCQPETYESFVDFMGDSKNQIMTRYESKTDVPNYYIFDIDQKSRKPLTSFKDPAPQLTGIKKELIKYTREDGVELSGTLYLPPGHKKGKRLPLVVWAYPREFSNARVAGQIRGSSHRFTYYRGYSQLFFITQGYALLDNAQMPVIGDPETMNDTFVQQIVASAKAAIDKLDDMGIVDPNRVGVGGHSYGAFMTANLLAHCDLFSAGIARSGAYNRTLTPFGFQSERRTFWEVPEIYFKLSPFMHANKVNEPILLIHGEVDNNSGTFPIQSKRFYHAIKGHGATAKLVMLPNESHGYRARESVLHVLAEMFDWFDEHVKNKD